MREIIDLTMDAERALYGLSDAAVRGCRFEGPTDGESALKRCRDLDISGCRFVLRYPLWHGKHIVIKDSEMTETCRAALWYCDGVKLDNVRLRGVKALRECGGISVKDCEMTSAELLWRCNGVDMERTVIASEYPFFESHGLEISHLDLKGKYSFQYTENVTIRDSVLDTKDAFWHSKNVAVFDSEVRGEYLGWYSANLRLVRCRISGTQPLCCCTGLVLEECTMDGCDLSFELSEVRADVRGGIDSVKNPLRGRIAADRIGRVIMETGECDPRATEVILRGKAG